MRAVRCMLWLTIIACPFPAVTSFAQSVRERVDLEMVAKIKEEGLQRSKVMESISYLTDVHGPRLTGSPMTKAAGEWAKTRLTEWGLQNAQLETWGTFGRGWTLEGFTANLVKPNFSSLIAYPKAWSPSTPMVIRGKPIYVDASDEKDLEKYRGKLHRAIVLLSPPREVKALFDPPARRQSDEALLGLANSDGGTRSTRPSSPGGPNGRPSASPAGNPPPDRTPANSPDARSSFQLQTKKWQLVYEEGAAVVLEPGRGDGGTVFVGPATLPTRRDAPGQGFGNRPSAWSKDAPEIIPQTVVAVEHYNRLVRMLQKGVDVELEIDIAARYHDQDLTSFNVIAEIPGSDLKEEIVMLGGHFDSWHSGTGATDNAVGCGVSLEAVRILQAIGAKPRRTIRIALWTGEEQGLLGSKAYVAEHFGKAITPPRSGPGPGGGNRDADNAGGDGARPASAGDTNNQPPSARPSTKYELKPDHARFAAYFNLDNGTGKIRGVYLQGNEAVRPIFRAWLTPFAEMGASTLTQNNTGGTDHLSFDAVGLPGFQFIQDPLEYDTRTHHSSMDVFDRVQEDDMKQASIIMASFVYHAAMRDEKLPRKTLQGEVVSPAAASN